MVTRLSTIDMLNCEEWWAVKIVALLHDIPWKPWVVTGKYSGRNPGEEVVREVGGEVERLYRELVESLSKQGSVEANDREALAAIVYVFSKTDKSFVREVVASAARKYWWSIVHRADTRAASADRIVSPTGVFAEPSSLVNIFRPELKLQVAAKNPPSRDIVKRYLDRLVEVVEKSLERVPPGGTCESLRRAYLALYTLLEPEWYRAAGVGYVPLADTKTPHHTLFAHLYASASMVNTLGRWAVVEIDMPGIQEVVGRGRKTRDFWAGSWLISLLTWTAIKELVEAFGPDIVLSPHLQLNPFYLDMVVGEEAVDKNSLPRLAWLDEWPSQPVAPGTARLVLPVPTQSGRGYVAEAWSRLAPRATSTERAIEEHVKETVEEAWKKLANGILEEHEEEIKKLLEATCRQLAAGEETLKECKETHIEYLEGVLEEPLVSPVVVAVEVDLQELRHRVERVFLKHLRVDRVAAKGGEPLYTVFSITNRSRRKPSVEEVIDRVSESLILPYAYRELIEAKSSRGKLSLAYGARAYKVVHNFTEKVYRGDYIKRYRSCSVCGSLPAVVVVPRVEGSRQVEELLGGVHYVVDEGETLCPYCLAKRLLAKNPEIARRAGLVASEPKKKPLLSTLDIANVWKIVESKVPEILEAEKSDREELLEVYKPLKGLDKSLEKLLKAASVALAGKGLDLILATKARGRGPAELGLASYVAYIVSDGDNIGRGVWRGILPKPPPQAVEYVEKAYMSLVEGGEDAVGELLDYALGPASHLYHLLVKAGVHRVFKEEDLSKWLVGYGLVVYTAKKIGIADRDATILVTPSYATSISRGLAVASLVDSIVVDSLGGVVVYAGGDDLAAIAPVVGVVYRLKQSNRDVVVLPIHALSKKLEQILAVDPGTGRKPDWSSIERKLLEKTLETQVLGSKYEQIPLPLVLAILTRLNYWGLLSLYEAPIEGFHVYDGVVEVALTAYGRSTGLHLAHYKDNMWSAYKEARELEEHKDSVKLDNRKKDLLITSSSRGPKLLAVLPHTLEPTVEKVTATLRDTCKLHLCLETKQCSRALVYDLTSQDNISLVQKILSSSTNPQAYVELLHRIVERHTTERALTSTREALLRGDNKQNIVIELEQLNQAEKLPLPIHLALLLRHLLTAQR